MGLLLAVLGAVAEGAEGAGGGGPLDQILNSGPLAPILGAVGSLGFVGSALWYIIKFQRAFTEKLEESEKKKERRIGKLERRVAAAEGSERRCQYRLASMGRLLIEHGIPWEEPDFPWETEEGAPVTDDADEEAST
jgi:hypothetical protein